MNLHTINPKLVREVLLHDGWHVIVEGTFSHHDDKSRDGAFYFAEERGIYGSSGRLGQPIREGSEVLEVCGHISTIYGLRLRKES